MFFLHSGLWTLDESPNPVQNNYYYYYSSPLHFQCLAKGSGAHALKTTFLQNRLFDNLWRRDMKWLYVWFAQELGLAILPLASKCKLGQFLHQLAMVLLGQLLPFIGHIKTAPQAASNTTHPKLHRSTEGVKAFWRLAIRPIQLPQLRRPVPAGDYRLFQIFQSPNHSWGPKRSFSSSLTPKSCGQSSTKKTKKEKNKWGTTKNLRSRPKHGSREETAQSSKWLRKVEVSKKNKKIKNLRNGSLVYTYTRTYVKVEIFRFKCMRNPPARMFKLRDSYSTIN